MKNRFTKEGYKKNLMPLKKYFDLFDETSTSEVCNVDEVAGIEYGLRFSKPQGTKIKGVGVTMLECNKISKVAFIFPITSGINEEGTSLAQLEKYYADFMEACREVFDFVKVEGPFYVPFEAIGPLENDRVNRVHKYPLDTQGISDVTVGKATAFYSCEDRDGFLWGIGFCLRTPVETSKKAGTKQEKLHMIELVKKVSRRKES